MFPRQPGVLGPVDAPPARRAGSVRRTASTYMTWPDGAFKGLRLQGRCRDILTTSVEGDFTVLADHSSEAVTELDRTIRVIASPDDPRLAQLVGARAGNALRAELGNLVADLRDEGAPLYLLLDDLAGASLIANFAWFRWRAHIPELADFGDMEGKMTGRSMAGICIGFTPGGSGLNPDGSPTAPDRFMQPVLPIYDPNDVDGWHALPAQPPEPMAMRRARRIDLWFEDDELRIDAMFRDSCWDPDGSEKAVHEYSLRATVDPSTMTLTSVVAEPRALPFAECPGAAANVDAMVGAELATFRLETLERIKGIHCCTHLNDALRALAEVPVLARHLS